MESSGEEDDFPTHEWITPQSKINSIYQSNTEKRIRRLCCELLDLKDAVENLCGNMQSKYLAFLRISEEAVEVKHELIELQKHVSTQGILVQDMMSGVCCELDEWNLANADSPEAEEDSQVSEPRDPLLNELDDHKVAFLENVDILLAEHKVEEALEALIAEEKNVPELNGSDDSSLTESSSYKSAFMRRKAMLGDQLVEICEQPSIGFGELKKVLSSLVRIGKGPLAHQILLKAYGSRLQKNIELFLPSCSIYPETYSASLSKIVFSIILLMAKESQLIFGDTPAYANRIVQWTECELESFVRLVKEHAPSSEMVSALRSVSICVQASFSHCLTLESQGLKLCKLLMMNFRRARRMVLDLEGNEGILPLSPRIMSPLSPMASSDNAVIDSGTRFMFIVRDIVEQLTPVAITHFGGAILTRISHLFEKYVDVLIKALPGPSEDDNVTEHKELMHFRIETDAQQLSLLGTAFTVADELLPVAVSRIWSGLSDKESGTGRTENIGPSTSNSIEFKEWRRHLQHSLDKLRDHFCRQYVLNFIYSREGNTQLDAQIYLDGKGKDLFWDSHPLPSLPFQALFAKLQQLATVAGDVLLGKEKIQKILLSRLTETVVMWLSDEQEFWDVFEDDSCPLKPLGLQQLILDMHFTVEIAVCGGYPSRNVHQIASAIIARAVRTFSARGIDPQSALPEDEWFVDTAKAAINKLLMGTSGSEASDIDEGHMIIHDDISDSDDTDSCPSTIESSTESFASANMEEVESPNYSTDPES
ncbi:hypothetical protein AQUCO_03000377v1 [Aquilegia coerulea]|uniref:Exocyst component Exo84 C-terminal domain-containing protein n=1 Tax=Aquilegia coerulea TaxID=218851 RepID=A0A2G5D2Q7_AQUCA|nr:hypothetical protein AQUCO_03000377v1 [Aquilegia coerulea]